MLGYGQAESNQLEEGSVTLTLAMRRACRNILYTIGNSGYYANPASVSVADTGRMEKLFYTIDGIAVAAAVLLELAIVLRYILKKKKESGIKIEVVKEKDKE